jgi:hypothetical protein
MGKDLKAESANIAKVVEDLQQKALRALERNDRHTARKYLRKGLRIVEKTKDAQKEAEFHLALGLSYLRMEGMDCRRMAFEEIMKAGKIALELCLEPLLVKSLRYLSEAIDSFEDLRAMENLVEDASKILSRDGQSEAWRALAMAKMFLWFKGSVEGAVQGDVDMLGAEESVRKLVEQGLLPESYLHLLYAGQAQAKGDLATAELEAQGARQAALDAVDPFLYLLACGSIARIRDEAGDRVGALSILFTCKASIEDLLGPTAGGFVVLMIDALEKRWGKEVFYETLALYRNQFREAEPCKKP